MHSLNIGIVELDQVFRPFENFEFPEQLRDRDQLVCEFELEGFGEGSACWMRLEPNGEFPLGIGRVKRVWGFSIGVSLNSELGVYPPGLLVEFPHHGLSLSTANIARKGDMGPKDADTNLNVYVPVSRGYKDPTFPPQVEVLADLQLTFRNDLSDMPEIETIPDPADDTEEEVA